MSLDAQGATTKEEGRPLLNNRLKGRHVAQKNKEFAIGRFLGIIAGIIFLIAMIYLRLWIADGDWGCWFSDDPALCAVVNKNE